VRREAEALASKGFEVHVICLSEDHNTRSAPDRPHATVNGVQIHRLPISRKRGSALRYLYEYLIVGILGAAKLAKLHFQCKLDVVHVHNMPDILVLAALIPRLGGSKVILDVHDPMPELYMSWNHRAGSLLVKLLRVQERVSYAFADRIISVNESMRENLHGKGVADGKIFIVNNFPDERLFPLRETSASWPRERNELVLLYCGTVTEHYDLGLAVKAIAKLRGEIPVTLRIVGEGNRLNEVLSLASELGVADRIERVGSVPIEQVRDEMRKADIGISCHRAGVFGDLYFSTKIVEYMTQGLPVLSPRTYTINKYISDDIVFYFEPGSDTALADRLRFMWQHPTEVMKRVTAARQLVPRLSWQAERTKFLSFYADFVNDEAPRARMLSAS